MESAAWSVSHQDRSGREDRPRVGRLFMCKKTYWNIAESKGPHLPETAPRSRYALPEHKSRRGRFTPGLAMHSQSTSLAWGSLHSRSRYALPEHKSRLGVASLPVSLCTPRAQVSPGGRFTPGLAMHSQSTSLAWGRFTPGLAMLSCRDGCTARSESSCGGQGPKKPSPAFSGEGFGMKSRDLMI
ncbi:hypothetical protein C8P63_10726 [Melghirimyces profundicolus]|uniref:Uncharacterized protein n=1 Tax=Melghirimyces profundicolus TaxID=1242148 RepID=A0A2T6BYT9_9BACL|nr:hypothetical protein C8P63_10726 [Melghirimyces profundicolus]